MHRPWVPEPGLWFQWDFGDGPVVAGESSCLFCAWLAWCRFRVVLPIRDKTLLVACIDTALRRFGGCPTYGLSDNEKTVTIEHVARVAIRNPEMVKAANHYGLTVSTTSERSGRIAMAHPWHIRRRSGASECVERFTLISANDGCVLLWTPRIRLRESEVRAGCGYRATGRQCRLVLELSAMPIPTFIPTTGQTNPDSERRLRNIVPGQGTCTDVGERPFENYDLFEGTEQIQQLVISRAISGVHIR